MTSPLDNEKTYENVFLLNLKKKRAAVSYISWLQHFTEILFVFVDNFKNTMKTKEQRIVCPTTCLPSVL